jgi:hypothetical protein
VTLKLKHQLSLSNSEAWIPFVEEHMNGTWSHLPCFFLFSDYCGFKMLEPCNNFLLGFCSVLSRGVIEGVQVSLLSLFRFGRFLVPGLYFCVSAL